MKPSSTTIETIFNIILPNLLSGAKSQKTLPFPLLFHLASIVPLQPLPETTRGRFPVPATYLFSGEDGKPPKIYVFVFPERYTYDILLLSNYVNRYVLYI